jgi:hypothetical protein
MRRIRITEAHDYDLVGTLLPASGQERSRKPVPAKSQLINIQPLVAV